MIFFLTFSIFSSLSYKLTLLISGDTSRKGSFSAANNTTQISLYRVDEQDPYGFGLRVVGQQLPVDPQQLQQQQQQQLCARVLWISPGGPAQRAGIKVGDRVIINLTVILLIKSFETLLSNLGQM